MARRFVLVFALLSVAAVASAQPVAQGTLVASAIADLASTRAALSHSAGRELNPWAQSFAGQLALKAAGTTSVLVIARTLERRGHRRAARLMLYGISTATFAIAAHNWQVSAQAPASPLVR